MNFELLLTYYANLGESLEVGAGPYGNRLIVEVAGGEFEGEKLKGKIRDAGCADWLSMTEDFGHLDVRATFETHDGAIIYVEYTGKTQLTEAFQNALTTGKGGTEYGDGYFFTTPRMQTGDARYAWVNNIVCVGQGRLQPGRVEYNVYQVVN